MRNNKGAVHIILLVIVLLLVIIVGSWMQKNNKLNSTTMPIPETDEPTSAFQKINEYKVEKTPKHTLPPGIHESQLWKGYTFKDTDYALFIKRNINFFSGIDRDTTRSGVLYSQAEISDWKLLYEIVDTDRYKNNPYYLWSEQELYYSVVVDDYGAGSGEGQGKLIRIDPNSQEWDIVHCFYYSPEDFDDYLNSTSNDKPLSSIIASYHGSENYIKNNGVHSYDQSIGKFKINDRIKEACTAFDLII